MLVLCHAFSGIASQRLSQFLTGFALYKFSILLLLLIIIIIIIIMTTIFSPDIILCA